MSFLSNPIIAVIIMLGVLVLVHELGHYLVGKAFGIGAETFSIGFGPRIFGFRWQGTDHRIGLLPLGGYVKFVGSTRFEDVPEHLQGKELYRAPTWQKFLVIAAGPAANLLLAVVVYTVMVVNGIPHPPPVIGEVRMGSPAEKAGILSGDRITSVDGRAVNKWEDIRRSIASQPGKLIQIELLRDNRALEVSLTPDSVDGLNLLGQWEKQGRAGIALGVLPARLTLIGEQPVAKTYGLRTGDLILEAHGNDEKRVIENYSDLLNVLSSMWLKQDGPIRLLVEGPSHSGGAQSPPIPGDRHFVELPLDIWQTHKEKLASYSNPKRARELAKIAGFSHAQLTINEVKEPSLGFLSRGDRLVAWEGETLVDYYHLIDLLQRNKKPQVNLKIERNQTLMSIQVPLKPIDAQRPEGKVTIYQFPVTFLGTLATPDPFIEQYSNPLRALGFGLEKTAEQIGLVISSIVGLITGDVPMKALGGPMMIAKVAGDSAKLGWQAFVNSLALISINLGLINLFPIPVLDGGQLVIIGTEAIRRRPLSQAAFENFQKFGFVMVFALVILATYNDISRFWKSMLEGVTGVF